MNMKTYDKMRPSHKCDKITPLIEYSKRLKIFLRSDSFLVHIILLMNILEDLSYYLALYLF